MTSPKHLWSGNWEEESAAAARRERQVVEPEPEPQPQIAEPVRRPRPRPRRRPRVPRAALVVALLALLLVGGAYAARSLDHSNPAPTSSSQTAWLGAGIEAWPTGGALVASVSSGGPADAAGLRPGDIITEVEGRPVGAAVDVTEAVAALQPGDVLTLQVQRGRSSHSLQVKLAAAKPGVANP